MIVPVIASTASLEMRAKPRVGGRGPVAGDDEVEDTAGVVAEEGGVLASELGSEVLVDSGSGPDGDGQDRCGRRSVCSEVTRC